MGNTIDTISSLIKAKKWYIFIGFILVILLIDRTVLLQKPNTELTYTVKQENLVDTVQVSGTYTTASQTQVGSPTNGIIDQLFVKNGDQVKKGDSLFHVQSTATIDQEKTAYASYLTAKSIVDADNAKLNSLQSLMFQSNQTFINDKGVTNPSDLQKSDPKYVEENADWLAAEANYKNQQGVIAKDQAALSSALLSYNETQSVTVTSPSDGSVVNLLVRVGYQVSALQPIPATSSTNSQTMQATTTEPVLVIANLSDPYIKASVNENNATQISAEQKANIVFDAMPNQSFNGSVADIDTIGTNTQGVITYSANITPDSLPSNIKPNMTALITIETLRKDNVIDVPNSAIVTNNGSSYVLEAKTHKHIPVTLGTKGMVKTELLSGLLSGNRIVANPGSNTASGSN